MSLTGWPVRVEAEGALGEWEWWWEEEDRGDDAGSTRVFCINFGRGRLRPSLPGIADVRGANGTVSLVRPTRARPSPTHSRPHSSSADPRPSY